MCGWLKCEKHILEAALVVLLNFMHGDYTLKMNGAEKKKNKNSCKVKNS